MTCSTNVGKEVKPGISLRQSETSLVLKGISIKRSLARVMVEELGKKAHAEYSTKGQHTFISRLSKCL